MYIGVDNCSGGKYCKKYTFIYGSNAINHPGGISCKLCYLQYFTIVFSNAYLHPHSDNKENEVALGLLGVLHRRILHGSVQDGREVGGTTQLHSAYSI